MDWIASVFAIACAALFTRKVWWAPIFGVCAQFYWMWYAITIGEYGLLLCAGLFVVVYAVAIPKWYRERTG